ncbi:MAG: substrate-binding domain-containing protein [Spirochaetota bacterium]|nr:substrate-binding domain-containing protein [Spirochaetota bacterium]
MALLFGLAFLVFLFLTIQLMVETPFLSNNSVVEVEEVNFHYAFFVPEEDSSFFRRLREGAKDAASSRGCAISFHSIDLNPFSFEMARYSGFDGFGLYLYEKDRSKLQYLAEILGEGIPVVQIENEVIQGPGSFFIGTNNFDVGKGIGQLAKDIDIDNLNMVLVYSKKNPGIMSDRNLVEMGLKTVLGDKLSSLSTELTSLNPLDTGLLAYDLLKNKPSVDIIVLTDPNDTLMTVQAIIDMNLVGRVHIIGFGEHETIKSYIEKGVILGSIVRNPYRIGFSTVMALNELSTNGYTSAYADTGITILSGNSQ